MKYNEVVTVMETVANALPVSFYHYTEEHVNEYQGDFPVAVMFPPSASISYNESNGVASTASYDIRIAFMDLISPESDRSEKQTVVDAQHNNAASMVITLIQGEDLIPEVLGATVRNIRIDPFFTFPWNSHLTAGVLLEFTWDTVPTWDCAQVPATTLPDPAISWVNVTNRINLTNETSIKTTVGGNPTTLYQYRPANQFDWQELQEIPIMVPQIAVILDPGTYYFRMNYTVADGRTSQWSNIIEGTIT